MLNALNNGSEILAQKIAKNGFIVLAKVKFGQGQFVTWYADKNGDAYWGHYFSSHDEAMADFYERG